MNDAKERYYQLIDGICALAGIAQPQTMYENCSIDVNKATFTLMHADYVHPELVVVYVDFGKPPAESRELVLQRLLETNVYMFLDIEGPAFSFNPETGHVMFMCRLMLANQTADSLLAFMKHVSDYVASWQSNYFLSDQERAGKKAGVGNSQAHALHRSMVRTVETGKTSEK